MWRNQVTGQEWEGGMDDALGPSGYGWVWVDEGGRQALIGLDDDGLPVVRRIREHVAAMLAEARERLEGGEVLAVEAEALKAVALKAQIRTLRVLDEALAVPPFDDR